MAEPRESLALPPGLRPEQILRIKWELPSAPSAAELTRIQHRWLAQIEEVACGNPAAIDAVLKIDPDLRPPAVFDPEWVKDAHWRLSAIEIASTYFEWVAVTPTGEIALPPQSPRLVAMMLRQEAVERDFRKVVTLPVSYSFKSGPLLKN